MKRFSLVTGDSPLVAVAVHAGHGVRPDLLPHFALTEAGRLYEEDPGTDFLAEIAPSRLISHISRFEHDLNRPREKAVYRSPADAWGLTVWRPSLTDELIAESLAHYDAFYITAMDLFESLIQRHGRILVMDMHSYCHRRGGPSAPSAEQSGNPEIDIGTTEASRSRWHRVVDAFVGQLQQFPYDSRHLDVRENTRFRGPGHFSRWVESQFAESACVISVEVKKIYMDEWSGEIEFSVLERIRAAVASAVDSAMSVLRCR